MITVSKRETGQMWALMLQVITPCAKKRSGYTLHENMDIARGIEMDIGRNLQLVYELMAYLRSQEFYSLLMMLVRTDNYY